MSDLSCEGTGYPEERQHALELVQERVKSLEDQLIPERNFREAILKDIATIHFLRTPLSRLPQDTLSSIFKAWDDNPFLRNRTLCLVCKTWYRIVWSSTTFWTNVILRPEPHAHRLSALCRFAELCSQRSADKPLDVVIDFSAIVWYNIFIGKILDKRAQRFSFLPPHCIPDFAGDAESDLSNPHAHIPNYPYEPHYQNIPQIFVRQLMNQNEELCHRWRSLRLILREWGQEPNAAHKILCEMTGNMANLVKIDIRGCDHFYFPGERDANVEPFPDFPGLNDLTTTKGVKPNHSSMEYSQIKVLRLLNHGSSRNFLHTAGSKFSSLLTLELLLRFNNLHSDLEEPVLLPRLTSLTLRGIASAKYNAIRINAPNLEWLHIEQGCYSPFIDRYFFDAVVPFYNTVKIMLIDGCPYSRRKRGEWTVEVSYEALSIVLMNTPALVLLRLKEGDWGTDTENLALIQAVRDEGFPLAHLKEVIYVDKDQHFLTEDVSHLSILKVSSDDMSISEGMEV